MNVIVKHDGTDISNWLVSYDREHEICTGIGSVEVILPFDTPRTFHPWDVIEIWENSNKKGKFYISDIDKSAKDGTINLLCDDESKKLSGYFITESYTIDYLSYSRTWIEKFLDEAKVNYTFTVDASDNGVPLSNNTTLGFDTAFNILTTLLQQSGWYIYFDPNGTAIIGDLNKDVNNPDHTINAADFTQFNRELDDDRLRNRAVVWGNTNPTYGEVFVDISVQTPWNYDAQDKRAVVISNSSIYNHSQALTLAHKLLNEFTKIKDEKFLLVVNDYNMKLGEIVKVNSTHWSGRGLITRLSVTASEDGLLYGVTLDQNCPRMFTFYSTLPPTISGFYVYTGHISDGIWRKHTEGSTWYDNSAGLESGSRVNDLFIRNGTFATVLDDGYLYTKTSENGFWNKYSHGSLRDIQGNTYIESNIRAKACSINLLDNVIAGYNYVPSGVVASGIPPSGLSWVLELTGNQSLIKAEQVVISGGVDDGGQFSIFDLESTGEYNIVAVSGYVPISGYYPSTIDHYNNYGSGYRDVCLVRGISNMITLPPDSNSLAMGWGYGDTTYSDVIVGTNATYPSGLVCDEGTQIYWYTGWNGVLVKLDPNTKTQTTWNFTVPSEWTALDSPATDFGIMLRHKSGNDFDIVVLTADPAPATTYTLYHYTYTLGDSTLTTAGSTTFSASAGIVGSGLISNKVIVGYATTSATVHAKILNLTTTSFSTVDIFTGLGASYQGLSGKIVLFSSGEDLVLGFVYIAGTDLFTFPNCPALPKTAPRQAELFAAGYKINQFGSESNLGQTSLAVYDVPAGTDYFDFGGFFTQSSQTGFVPHSPHEYVTTDTLIGKAYWMCPIRLNTTNCAGSTKKYAGLTIGVSFPDKSIFYNKWGDNETWWDLADSYETADGSELVKKNSSSIPVLRANLLAQYGKYSGAGFLVYYSSGTTTFGEFRHAPSYSTSEGYGSTYDPLTNITNWHSLDDLTGQIVFGTTTLPADAPPYYFMMANKGNFRSYNSRMSIGTFTGTHLTQHFGVTHAYRLYLFDISVVNDYPKGTVLKHTSNANIGTKTTASESALEQTIGNFEIIKTTKFPTKVDIAHGVPTVIYDIPKNDLNPVTHDFWASIINEEDSFYTHAVEKPVYESRTLNLLNPSAFPTASGTFTEEDYERYIGISNVEGILASKYDLSTPWVNLVTVASGVAISGLITHFETSNFVPEGTYIFYTVSGVKSFFQKNPDENFWRDYSAGLPESPITIIRVDDII